MTNEARSAQVALCKDMGAQVFDAFPDDKVGISQTALDGKLPLNGLRHGLEDGLTGWFIWGGEEFSEDADFFKSIHPSHLADVCPLAAKFFLLPPGWRFLTDGDYEDVWFDASLLDAEIEQDSS